VSKAAKSATGKGAGGNETADGGKTQRGIQSVEVGGRVLLALAQARSPLALSDLATAAQIAPGQAHAYLVSLSRLGLIKRDELSGRYEPGPLSLRLGLMHLENQPAFRAAVPRVAALAEAIGFSVAICIAGPQGPTARGHGDVAAGNVDRSCVLRLSATRGAGGDVGESVRRCEERDDAARRTRCFRSGFGCNPRTQVGMQRRCAESRHQQFERAGARCERPLVPRTDGDRLNGRDRRHR
jgi:hypothetical protein